MAISRKIGLESTSWASCKYTLEVTLEFNDGVSRKLNDVQITGLYLEKDYDNDIFPVLLLDLSISKNDRYKIDDNTVFHLRMEQFYFKDVENTTTYTDRKIYMDERFVRIDPNVKINPSENLEKQIQKSTGNEDGDMVQKELSSQYTFVLIKKSDFIAGKNMINAVITSSTQQDIVSYILSTSKFDRKILMTPFSNKNIYSELILQPKTSVEQLRYLEKEFGWYEEGAYIFDDYNVFYIIRKNGKCTAWRKNASKHTVFCLSNTNSSDSKSNGVIRDNDVIYISVGATDFNKMDTSIVEDQLDGSNIILVNTLTGESTVVETESNKLGETGSYTTKMVHGHNPYESLRYKRIKEENNNRWELNCANVDLSALTPEKHFSFLTDMTKYDKELKGNFRISYLQVGFIKNGRYFDTESTIRVKRATK